MTARNSEKYKQLAAEVGVLHQIIKNRDIIEANLKPNQAISIAKLLQDTDTQDEDADKVAEAIVELGIIEIVDMFLDAYAWKCQAVQSLTNAIEDEQGQGVLGCYFSTLLTLYFATERYAVFCVRATEKGVIEAIVDELAKPEMLKQRCEPVDDLYSGIALFYVKTITNITGRTPTAVEKFNQERINLLKKYIEGDNYMLNCMALFAVSSIATEADKISISSELAAAILNLMKAILTGSITDSVEVRYTLTELLESLCQVANCSDNFITKIIDVGILEMLDAILNAPAPLVDTKTDRLVHGAPSDPTRLVENTNDIEKLLAIKLCWMAKFNENVRIMMIARKSTMEALHELVKCSKNQEIKTQAKDLLNTLQASNKAEKPQAKQEVVVVDTTLAAKGSKLLPNRQQQQKPIVQRTPKSEKTAEQVDNITVPVTAQQKKICDRIFVSYSHKQQRLVFSLVDKLRAAGFKNVFTDQTIAGDWYTWMVEQVEQADIVLVCFSKSYYESGNCKDEAMNARALGKVIIPCKMEDYNPISWLGGITRVRLWRDYSNPSSFEDSVSKLVDELKSCITSPDKHAGVPTTHSTANPIRREQQHNVASTAVTNSAKAAQPSSSGNNTKTAESSADQLARVNLWDEQETKHWLASIGYPAAQVEPGSLNGKFITGLMLFARKSPDTLCEQLLKQKGINFDKAILIVGELAAGPSK